MTTLLFIWYIFIHVADAPVCNLWIDHTPSAPELSAACRGYDLASMHLNVYTYKDHQPICPHLKGIDVYNVQTVCLMPGPLDDYLLELVVTAHDELFCSVAVTHEEEPTVGEIADQCGPSAWPALRDGSATLTFIHVIKREPPASMCVAPSLPIGASLYEQVTSADGLASRIEYAWLAGRLIWFGLVDARAVCGYNGLTNLLTADACGMRAALPNVIAWQNRWDADIYSAAVTYSVPARLLKRMIGVESQFWPLYVGRAGEMGVMQVTENGADVLLRYDPALEPDYAGKPETYKFWRRLQMRNEFDCRACGLTQALERTRILIPMYARLLAAFRCRAVEMDRSLSGTAAWQQAAQDYNGAPDYITKLETQTWQQ